MKGSGLSYLRRLPRLRELDLSESEVTDLKHLADIATRLRILDLSHSRITDDAGKTIAKLKTLEELYLRHTELTDEGLSCLHELRCLKTLSIGSVEFSETAVEELKFGVPTTKVEVVLRPYPERGTR